VVAAELWPGDSPAAWIDDIGHAIAERYRRIEDALRETLERLATQHLDAPDDTLARYRAIQHLREQAERLVSTVDPASLARWATEEAAMGASAEIARQLLEFPAYAAMGVSKVTSLTAGGAYAVAAVELDLRDSLRALNARILRAPVDAYQAMTSKHIGSLLAGVTTSQALHRRILDEYIADGITGFIDKSNRRWTIGAYSEMATRTGAHRAWGDQAVASMEAAGITTLTPVIGNSACENCAQWAGKILTRTGPTGDVVVKHAITGEPTTIHVDATLDEWRASKAGHPNCRCVMVPGLPGGPDPSKHSTWDKQKEQDREKLRELERDVRSAKRDGDPDAIGEAQAALREHVEKTGITRRGYREQLPFADGGDTNPRGRTVRHQVLVTKQIMDHIVGGEIKILRNGRKQYLGGHAAWAKIPGKTHFPRSWSRAKILQELDRALEAIDIGSIPLGKSYQQVVADGIEAEIQFIRTKKRARVSTFFPLEDHPG
jgi:hypothetical protein